MSLQSFFINGIKHLVFERPGKKYTLTQHLERLAQSGERVGYRMAAANNTEAQRKTMAHIIGMERWGQRRLRIGLGEPPISDEHDGYCPAATLSPVELQQEFKATRQETLDLAKKLADTGLQAEFPHNMFGTLSFAGWLAYFYAHAEFESSWLKA